MLCAQDHVSGAQINRIKDSLTYLRRPVKVILAGLFLYRKISLLIFAEITEFTAMEKVIRTKIKDLLKMQPGQEVLAKGWVRTKRGNKQVKFIALNDGSTINNIQIVAEAEHFSEDLMKKITTGASLAVRGQLVESLGSGQHVEIKAESIEIYGECDPMKYPLQKKDTSLEYLRTVAHMRLRTNTFGAILRVRNAMAFAIHSFFQSKGFVYLNTPLITESDAEGAGDMFQVTTMDLANIPMHHGKVDFSKDFFGKKTSLTVSGQLEGELGATAVGDIYTFGPTFRAENSNTPRHLAEFWMIEPEMAFADLDDDMFVAEAMLKYVINYVLENAPEEMNFFNSFVDKGLLERLHNVVSSDFARVTYTEAVELLEKHNDKFEYKVTWGTDLQTEHERYLTEEVFKRPVFVTDYPKEIKAFYMKLNDDGKTVAAVDCLVPGIGEIIGGSQREDDYDKLKARMDELGLKEEDYKFYMDLRKYGSTRHAGFGLGFERCVMYLTGMGNIRDVIPFPRTVNNCEL